MPFCQLYALLTLYVLLTLCVLQAFRRLFWLSGILLVTGARLDAQYLASRCPSNHSAYSSLPDILVVTRPSMTTLRHPGYSEPFDALLVTRRFPVCLATRVSEPSVAIMVTPRSPDCSLASFWLACIMHIPY